MSATTIPDWIHEDDLAKSLGVDRDTVKRHRPHVPTGGVRTNAKAIEWNAEAAAWLASRLQLPAPQFQKNAAPMAAGEAAPGEKTAPPASALPGEELAVVSKPTVGGRHFANPHIIKARRADGSVVDVRVMDSAKYQPTLCTDKGPTDKPMMIRAKKATGGNWWELLSREPRWRGRF